MQLTLTLTDTKLTVTKPELRAIRNALPTVEKLSRLVSGHETLTDIHLQAEGARESLKALLALLDPPTGGRGAVERAVAEEIAKG